MLYRIRIRMSTTLVCGFEFEPTSESELPESYKTQTITKKGLEAHPDRENLVLSVKVRGRVCIRLLATSAYQKRTSDPESCDKNASVACVSRFGFLLSWSSCSLPTTFPHLDYVHDLPLIADKLTYRRASLIWTS